VTTPTAHAEPIDVLAVLDRISDASASRRLNFGERDEVYEARAAVSELMEAVAAYDAAKQAAISNPALDGEYQDAEARMDDALARCTGATK